MLKGESIVDALKLWFEGAKRPLPWRYNPSPYRVWVSEVMLQQTQAVVVIPYFNRWMERFPDIATLAEAQEEEVLKLWEGLGYYSRARRLLSAARTLVTDFGGELPQDPEALQRVKGLGPYTVGAIRSFAFHQRAAAVDGNVCRVVSRLFGIEGDIDREKVRQEIAERVLDLLPQKHAWIVMEALIELGAQVCKKKATCPLCPISPHCFAYATGRVDALPKRRKRPAVVVLHREVFLIACQGAWLVQQHVEGRIMGGLWEFPYTDRGQPPPFVEQICRVAPLKRVTHTFTRFRAYLYPALFRAEAPFEQRGYKWVASKKLHQLAFSSGHRKILTQFLEEYADLTHGKF